MTPSETLLAAADRVRGLAAAANGPEPPAGTWWALLSPETAAPLLADWLETEAACIALVEDGKSAMPKLLEAIAPGAVDEDMTVTVVTSGSALAFAQAILGEDATDSLRTPATDPGDGRQWCAGCQRWKFLVIHSCLGGSGV